MKTGSHFHVTVLAKAKVMAESSALVRNVMIVMNLLLVRNVMIVMNLLLGIEMRIQILIDQTLAQMP